MAETRPGSFHQQARARANRAGAIEDEEAFEPVIPEGWTTLYHGTNYVKWQNFDIQNADRFTIRRGLSVVSQHELDKQRQDTGGETKQTYGIVAQPPDMDDETFARLNRPFEIRVVFYGNAHQMRPFMSLRDRLEPEAMDLIAKYYYKNRMMGRHPLIPGKTELIRLGVTTENDVDVYYYVPAPVAAAYQAESGVDLGIEE